MEESRGCDGAGAKQGRAPYITACADANPRNHAYPGLPSLGRIAIVRASSGGVAEWLKALAWKAGIRC